ncbi:MAG TPA: NADH-quinone oxidoreductase subunit N [Verrucomicrobiae bacterium]|nr:NADH-quinone oxidoreductase subunit N [Verrucomicrobiae bacterium]
MFPPIQDLYRIAPEIVLCGFGMLVMLLAPVVSKARHGVLAGISLVGAALALVATYYPARYGGLAYSGLFRADAFSLFVHWIVCGAAFLVILGSIGYLKRDDLDAAEFCALILFATAGMGVMAGAHELLTAFIGLEMSSISSYILASYRRDAPRSNEAAMKYFLLGSFATAFFLYGIALSFGATGSTHLDLMMPLANDSAHTLLKIGLGFIFIGLAFKVAAAPFQLWTPDVYEGAPTPVTALLSTGPKAAAFALALRIMASVDAAAPLWFWALWVAAALSMFAGNLSAIVQTSVKRMLAYSSIAHAGYILVALTAAAATDHPEAGIAAALFYLVGYALVKMGAFLIVAQLGGPGERHVDIEDFTGLGRRQPAMAACLSLFLLSLLGLPITAGFLGKFYVFNAALESNLIWLAILLALNSVIGAYYYLRVIVVMYMRESSTEIVAEPVPWTLSAVLWIAAAGTVFAGLFPARIIDFAAKAALNIR